MLLVLQMGQTQAERLGEVKNHASKATSEVELLCHQNQQWLSGLII